MKIGLVKWPGNHASVLVVVLCSAVALAVALGSYLFITNAQTLSVRRAQQWNAALAIAEAGAEEALAHLNANAPFVDFADATNRLATDGWIISGYNTLLSPVRYLGGGFYRVTITINWPNVQIDTYGLAPAPKVSFGGLFGSILGAASTSPNFIQRQIRIMARVDPLFSIPLGARYRIDLNGNNVFTDAFDSEDPNYSDNGRYPVGNLNKIKAEGNVCTSGELIDSIALGNANIMGKVKTGPSGVITIGPQGSVGDVAWVSSGKRGIQPGWAANDMNVVFPEVRLPSATWIPKAKDNKKIDGILYDYVFDTSGDYSIPGGGNIYVATNVKVRVLVTGNFQLNGNDDRITIAPQNASLILYMQGSSFKITGQGVVNQSGFATNFMYFGLPSNTSVDITGNGELVGLVYAPNANIFMRGGGNNRVDFIGSAIGYTVTMNGHFSFHYDIALQRTAGSRGFIPYRWEEIR